MKNKVISFFRDYEKTIENVAIILLLVDFVGLVWSMSAGVKSLAMFTLIAPAGIVVLLILCMLVRPKTMKHAGHRKSLAVLFGMGNIFYALALISAAIFVPVAVNPDTEKNYTEQEQARMIVIFVIMALIQVIGIIIVRFREKKGRYDNNPDLGKKDYSRLLVQTIAVAAGFALALFDVDKYAIELLFSVMYLEQAWYEIGVLASWAVEKVCLRLGDEG